MQNHHDCTRVARDSSGDLKDDHLQVQIHHDCIKVVIVDVLVVGPGRSIHKPLSEALNNKNLRVFVKYITSVWDCRKSTLFKI